MGLSNSKRKKYSMNNGDSGKKSQDAEGGVDPAVHGAQLEDRFYNNKSFQKPDIDSTNPEQQQAALQIQTKYRQYHAKKVVQTKREEKAAVKIQAGYRGHIDREKVKSIKESSSKGSVEEGAEEEVDIDLSDPEVASAATKIQAGFRGHKARKDLKEQQDDGEAAPKEEQPVEAAKEDAAPEETVNEAAPADEIDVNDPEQAMAASKIQAGFRGHRARQEVKALKETRANDAPAENGDAGDTPAEAAASDEKAEEELPDLADPELSEAATKIQASFKGFKTRKEFQEKRAANAGEGEEAGTAEGGEAEAGTAEEAPVEKSEEQQAEQ